MSKLALGTAQFSLNYGISNNSNKMSLIEAFKILNYAKKQGISLIDTAILYGESQRIIGKIGANDLQIVTKLPPLPKKIKKKPGDWVIRNIRNSLSYLDIKSLYGLLLHQSSDLAGETGKVLLSHLIKIKNKDLVKKIGVSIYDPIELEKIELLLDQIDIVQAPINLVDRRLQISGWLSKLKSLGIEVHARSVFLQGLLLMKKNKIPKKLKKIFLGLDSWIEEIKKKDLNPVEECLSYPLSLPEVDRVLIGVDSLNQLKNIVKVSNIKKQKRNWSFMISSNQMLINPSNWRKL